MRKKEENNKKRPVEWLILIIIIVVIIILLFFLLHKKESHITEETEDSEISALVCKSSDNKKAFFSSDTAVNIEHTVKIVYKDDAVSKISYEYNGEYNSTEEAKLDTGDMHTKYNIYLGGQNIKHESLTPVFQYSDGKGRVRLYLDDFSKLNSVTGKLFYIDDEMKSLIMGYSIEQTKTLFEKNGFSCIIN